MNRNLALLAFVNFAVGTAGMLVAGILSLIAQDLTISVADAGHLITAYALGFAIGSPLLTAATGTVCRKRVLLVGIATAGAGNIIAALAPNYEVMIAARVAAAAGGGLVVPAVSAIAAYISDDRNRAKAISTVLLGFTAATIFGVPAGTLLGSHLGWRPAMIMVGGFALFCAAVIWLALPGNIRVTPIPLVAWASVLRNWRTYLFLLVTVLFFSTQFVVFAYIAPFLEHTAHIDPARLSMILLWFGLASLAANRMVAWFAESVGPERFMFIALLGMTLAIGSLYWAPQGLWLVLTSTALWGLFGYAFVPLQQTRFVSLAPTVAGALLALNASAMFAGQATGASIGAFALDFGGPRELPIVAIGAGSLALLVFTWTWAMRIRAISLKA